jgi:putative membrane protein
MDFVTRAAESGNAEVDLAQLAQHTTEHAGLKAFAEQLERDHKQANEQLSDLVDRKDVDLPGIGLPGPTEAQKATHDRLDDLEGAAFDRAWIDQIVISHEKSVETYSKARESADPDVKAYAERTLPVIKTHLDHAKQLQKNLK